MYLDLQCNTMQKAITIRIWSKERERTIRSIRFWLYTNRIAAHIVAYYSTEIFSSPAYCWGLNVSRSLQQLIEEKTNEVDLSKQELKCKEMQIDELMKQIRKS